MHAGHGQWTRSIKGKTGRWARGKVKGKAIERKLFSLFPFAPFTTPAPTRIDSHTHTMILARLCSDLAVEMHVEWSAPFSFFAVFFSVRLSVRDQRRRVDGAVRSLLIACALAGSSEQRVAECVERPPLIRRGTVVVWSFDSQRQRCGGQPTSNQPAATRDEWDEIHSLTLTPTGTAA